MITLTNQQSLQFIYSVEKQNNNNSRFKFDSKHKCKCLNCLSTIYISYKQSGNYAVFCEKCVTKYQTKDIEQKFIQAQYMRKIKTEQLEILNLSNLSIPK